MATLLPSSATSSGRRRCASRFRHRSNTPRRVRPPAGVAGEILTGTADDVGGAAAAGVRIIAWCKACQRQIEPDPAEFAERYGADVSVPKWRERLVCSSCGNRETDMVLTGQRR
jgi:hypothetical protein